jgi:tetratricopeptide (TPR) repeat protein
MNKNFVYLFFVLIFLTSCDKEKRDIRKGNDFYQKSDYIKAEEQYRKSLVSDSNYLKAQYNLANASYKQQNKEKLQTALKYYEAYLKGNAYNDTISNANAIYNRGNVNFQMFNTDTNSEASANIQYLERALNDYKQTLRLNPSDSSAKYNLALTQYLLNKHKNQNQNQQNQQQDEQQQQQQQQQNQQDKKQEQQQNSNTPPQPQRMKDNKDTERMLEALKNNEKNTLEKVKKKEEQQVQKRHIEKDW